MVLMGSAACGDGALDETIVFLSYFKDLPDGRQQGKVLYPLPEVLLLCLMAVLAGAETLVSTAKTTLLPANVYQANLAVQLRDQRPLTIPFLAPSRRRARPLSEKGLQNEPQLDDPNSALDAHHHHQTNYLRRAVEVAKRVG